MKVNDFLYELPEELIAQHPLEKRDMSRLLMLNKNTGDIEHGKFNDILEHINKGDCLVLNETRVIPARLLGTGEKAGNRMEFLLLKRIKGDIWEVILKPGRRAKPGARFVFGDGLLKAQIVEVLDEGNRLVRFEYEGVFEQILDKAGVVPLPPYITCRLDDSERYQTVYSKDKGSAAAPTAGLHFTNELLKAFGKKGVNIAFLTLHVGLGTFRPVKTEEVEKHKMHSEYYTIGIEACNTINKTRNDGGRIIAVGTTSCRVIETASDPEGVITPGCGWTDIFIYPGYRFKATDALITNFHLPGSTLIMLVSAFAGRENVLEAYRLAILNKYRFFSFGDAMLIR